MFYVLIYSLSISIKNCCKYFSGKENEDFECNVKTEPIKTSK